MDQPFEHPTRTHREPKLGPTARKLLLLLIVIAVLSLFWSLFTTCNSALNQVYTRNNLNRIGLGLHNYHDEYGSFPIVVSEKNTKPSSRSWFFQTLRQTEVVPEPTWSLHHPELAWDDPQNREFFSLIPDIATNPSINKTRNEAGYGLIHYAANSQLFEFDRTVTLKDIKDGTSDTLLVGEINSNFPTWGAPGNARDPANGLGGGPNQFGSPDEYVVYFVRCDGGLKAISYDIDPAILNALASPAGGEDVDLPY